MQFLVPLSDPTTAHQILISHSALLRRKGIQYVSSCLFVFKDLFHKRKNQLHIHTHTGNLPLSCCDRSMFNTESDFHGLNSCGAYLSWFLMLPIHHTSDTILPFFIRHSKSICFGPMAVNKLVVLDRNQNLTTCMDFHS